MSDKLTLRKFVEVAGEMAGMEIGRSIMLMLIKELCDTFECNRREVGEDYE